MNTTQTTRAKARIFPSADANTEIAKTIRTIGSKFEVKWDDVNWTDETDYFLNARGHVKLTDTEGGGHAGSADFELDNTTGRFLPENISSPIYAYLIFRKEVRFSVKIGSYYFKLFTGYIKAIEPNRKEAIVNFHCFDNTVKVLSKRCPRDVYLDKRVDELLSILAEEAGLTSDEYDFEEAINSVQVGWFKDRYIWPVMGELTQTERGRIFFDTDGKLKFWNRDHSHNQTDIFTLTRDDWLKNLEFSIEEQGIKNRVTVRAKPRASAGIQIVWTNGDADILNQYSDTLIWIPANDQQFAYIEVEDPCTSWIEPVANSDFTANTEADGSGTDLTDSIKITEFIEYGDACYITVQNLSSQNAYLTKFEVRANPIRVWKWIQVIEEDANSVSNYGEQPILIENDFIDAESNARAIAREELYRWKDAKNLFRAEIIGVPQLRCGDQVSIELTAGNYETYMIESIEWDVDEQGFIQKLGFINPIIIPAEQTMFVLGNIKSPVNKTVTAKGYILTGEQEMQVKASIKLEQLKRINALGRVLVE